jgi:putative ABC transport system permease protein
LKSFTEVRAIGQAEYNFYAIGQNSRRFHFRGRYLNCLSMMISDGCAAVLQPDIIQGRWFEESDDNRKHPPVIINKSFGDALFGRENPLGKSFEMVSAQNEVIEALTVVGVVSDFRLYGEYDELRSFALTRTTLANPDNMPSSPLLIRIDASAAESLKARMLAKLQRLAPAWTFGITPVAMIREEKLKEGFAGFFSLGLVAFFLMIMVALGLTGVLWHNVTRRTREIGLRRAAGATVKRIFQQIAGEMIVITATAVILGIIFILHIQLLDIAAYFSWQSYVWGIAIAVAIIFLLTLVCTLYPGYLAIRIHPAEALHYE